MDVEFNPRASFVTKAILIDFLRLNEHTIYLPSSLNKHQLIQLVDDQRQRIRLNRTPTVNKTRTSPLRSTTPLRPVPGGTHTSPRRRSTPHSSPALAINLPPRAPGSDAGLQGRRGSDNPPGINQAATSPSPASAALTPSTGHASSTPTEPVVSILVAADPQNPGGPATLVNRELNLENIRESNGRVVEPILDSSHMTTINDHPLSDTSQDFNDNDSAQWSVIDAFEPFSKTETIADTFKIIGSPDDHSATRNTGFKSPGSYPAFLHETQQLPGAFPLDRAETLTTYPPLKLPADVCFIPSHDITPASSQGMLITIHSTLLHGTHGSFSSEVATRASKCLADFVNKTLLKLRHLSIVNKPDKRTPPHTIDGRTEFPAINSVNSKVGESGGTP
ncbi:hypothetical protein H4Q26_004574 [Puccinia striiformis f. sp. tritici PST-130]|nr:hypothetical protein H4Q26_004574 [Puccinia striiformis f. sp. tritici PST-130]